MKRRLPLAPAEGWLTLGLRAPHLPDDGLGDRRRPVGARATTTTSTCLVLAAVGGVLVGFIGPKVGWGRWLTFLIGAIFAALLVPLLTALAAPPDGAHDRRPLPRDRRRRSSRRYIDIAIRDLASTPQYLHYILTLGSVVWATSMFASYAVFGHHRPLNAVIVVGVVLVGEHGASPPTTSSCYLVLFSLGLAVPAHPLARLRRAVGVAAPADRRSGQSISSVYLRGGAAFIAVAVTASFVLTQTAASAPLAGAWDGVEDGLLSLSRSLSQVPPDRRLHPPARHRASGPNAPGPAAVDDQRRAGGHDPAEPDRQRHLLLASGHLRPDRPHRLGPEHVDLGRHPGRRTDPRPARRRRRSRKAATASRSR